VGDPSVGSGDDRSGPGGGKARDQQVGQ
jgi:hypothetical protein